MSLMLTDLDLEKVARNRGLCFKNKLATKDWEITLFASPPSSVTSKVIQKRTGAVDRVKNYDSYRLGVLVLNSIKRPMGIISLLYKIPLFIIANRKSAKENLPPLRSYSDYQRALDVKNHLNYRIGNLLIEVWKKPYRVFLLPRDLAEQVRLYNIWRGR